MSRRSTSDLFLLFQFVVASTAFVRAIQPHQHCEAYSDGITQCGRSHPSYITRGSDSCTSNNQHLIATAIAGADTSGRPILVDIAATVAATRSNGDGVRVSPRNRWSLPHGQNTPREGRIITKGAPGWGIMSACDNSNIIGSHRGAAAATPLWLRVRGGASTEVGESSDASVSSEGPTARAEDKRGRQETEEEEEPPPPEEQGTEGDGQHQQGTENNAQEEETTEGSIDEEEDNDDGDDERNDQKAKETSTDGGGEGSSDTSSAKAAEAAAAAKAQPLFALEGLGLGTVIPTAVKHMMVFWVGRWLSGKLSPEVGSQVRIARIIYTTYLIFSQALCMYLRYRIWQSDDDTKMETPPPPQLMSLLKGVGNGGERETPRAPAAAGTSEDAAASAMQGLMNKMLTTKTPVKAYDMKAVQIIRRRQFWASLFMCWSHLRRGMVRPMMFQVSYGLLSLLDSPLFKIYVLGMKAEGDLARPFKKQGLAEALMGPVSVVQARAQATQAAMDPPTTADGSASASAAGEQENEDSSAAATEVLSTGEDAEDEERDAERMPDIEVLSDDPKDD